MPKKKKQEQKQNKKRGERKEIVFKRKGGIIVQMESITNVAKDLSSRQHQR